MTSCPTIASSQGRILILFSLDFLGGWQQSPYSFLILFRPIPIVKY